MESVTRNGSGKPACKSFLDQVRHSLADAKFLRFREAKVVQTFQELWNTDELLVSFDAMCAPTTKRCSRVEMLTLRDSQQFLFANRPSRST